MEFEAPEGRTRGQDDRLSVDQVWRTKLGCWFLTKGGENRKNHFDVVQSVFNICRDSVEFRKTTPAHASQIDPLPLEWNPDVFCKLWKLKKIDRVSRQRQISSGCLSPISGSNDCNPHSGCSSARWFVSFVIIPIRYTALAYPGNRERKSVPNANSFKKRTSYHFYL